MICTMIQSMWYHSKHDALGFNAFCDNDSMHSERGLNTLSSDSMHDKTPSLMDHDPLLYVVFLKDYALVTIIQDVLATNVWCIIT